MMDRRHRVMLVLCTIFGLWHFATQWTTTLLAFIQWDTKEQLSIVDLGYIQSFGSLMNAAGALAFGQLADSTGPKTMFMVSCVITALYYMGIALSDTFWAFLGLQVLRFGYQMDGTTEMYLATITTESERTGALMRLTVPQALAMFVGPLVGSRVAAWTSLRVSQFICGIVLGVTLLPVLVTLLPTTHSVPRLAAARFRPQDYWPMISKNSALREGLFLRAMVVSAYVCYEMIARNFLLRTYMHNTDDSAEVLIVMSVSLLLVQFVILPVIQKRASPRTILQIALATLTACYIGVVFTSSLNQLLFVTAVQTGAYAVAYAESCTHITSSVESSDLGKATGLASMFQWLVHFFLPLYTSQLVEHLHFNYAFYTSAVLAAGTLVFVSLFARNTNKRVGQLLPSMNTNL